MMWKHVEFDFHDHLLYFCAFSDVDDMISVFGTALVSWHILSCAAPFGGRATLTINLVLEHSYFLY